MPLVFGEIPILSIEATIHSSLMLGFNNTGFSFLASVHSLLANTAGF